MMGKYLSRMVEFCFRIIYYVVSLRYIEVV